MNTDGHKSEIDRVSEKIIGCAFTVEPAWLQVSRKDLRERPVIELRKAGLRFGQAAAFGGFPVHLSLSAFIRGFSSFINHAAVHDRRHDFRLLDLFRIDFEDVARENYEVSELAGQDCAFFLFLKLCER